MGKERRKPVRFIRKRGRVIPIFDSKKKKKSAEAAALLSIGGGLSIGGAAVAGKLRKSANQKFALSRVKAQNAAASVSAKLTGVGPRPTLKFARRLPHLLKGQDKALSSAMKDLKRAEKGAKASFQVFKRSRLISAAFVGLGTEKVLDVAGFNETDLGREIGSEFIGVGAAALNDVVSNRVFLKAAHSKSIRKGLLEDVSKLKGGVKNTAINIAKKLAKKKFGF